MVIIFILPYDPFGKNRMVYTIRNQCVEDPSTPYNDGATKIFLYTKGTEGNPSQELKDMLQYMENTIGENVTNQTLNNINRIVEDAKRRKEVGINYMKSWEHDEMNREEGIKIGQAIGLQQGIEALISTCQELGLSAEEVLSKVEEKFALSKEQAQEALQKYWK